MTRCGDVDCRANSAASGDGQPAAKPEPGRNSGIVQRVFKALVCSVLFFIAIGAIGMWLATHRRNSGRSTR
jgi:hypothetical protein